MKIFKQLLWFIIPTLIIGLLLYVFTFGDKTNLNGFVSKQNYLRLFLNDPTFLRALFNTMALPLLLVVGIGAALFLIKQVLFRNKYSGVFYAVCFITTSLAFHLTAHLKLFMGLPPAAYSTRFFISTSSLVMQPNIPAILISMQIGVIICFICWCVNSCVNLYMKVRNNIKTRN